MLGGALMLAFLGDIGGGEILVVLAAILMLFGGKKLPSIARSLGKSMEELRRASQEFRDQLVNADRETDSPSPNLAPRPPATAEPPRGQARPASEPGEPESAAVDSSGEGKRTP